GFEGTRHPEAPMSVVVHGPRPGMGKSLGKRSAIEDGPGSACSAAFKARIRKKILCQRWGASRQGRHTRCNAGEDQSDFHRIDLILYWGGRVRILHPIARLPT